MRDGPWLAALSILRSIDGFLRRLGIRRPPREAGEVAAERFLRGLGYRTVARNWRSPRDPRDEADLLMLAPDHATLVVVEVKRARGPWDALDRVDRRKRAVLWRLLDDLAAGDTAAQAVAAHAGATRVRVDLVGVRGEGRSASAVRHVVGLFERRARDRPCDRPCGPRDQRQ
ncbi:MAG: YraN family protein [Planctomycetaceae bacterium]|nr:YraN family protein [Planctomycetaceae bacterium]